MALLVSDVGLLGATKGGGGDGRYCLEYSASFLELAFSETRENPYGGF